MAMDHSGGLTTTIPTLLALATRSIFSHLLYIKNKFYSNDKAMSTLKPTEPILTMCRPYFDTNELLINDNLPQLSPVKQVNNGISTSSSQSPTASTPRKPHGILKNHQRPSARLNTVNLQVSKSTPLQPTTTQLPQHA
jgi:hypothetical protein